LSCSVVALRGFALTIAGSTMTPG